MKLPATTAVSRIESPKLCNPELRYTNRPEDEGKKMPHIAYADASSNHCIKRTSKEICGIVAGTQVAGEYPNALDRLMNHNFLIQMDKNDFAVGLDIIPSRTYRGGVVPVSQAGVTTLQIQWEHENLVRRVIQRPRGTTARTMIKVLDELTAMAVQKKDVSARKKIGELGTVVSYDGEMIEIKLNNPAATPTGPQDLYGINDR